jgi:gluconokinase
VVQAQSNLSLSSRLCKIAWLRDEEPEVFARTALFGDATSYLVTRATGTLSIDVTCAAGTGMLDPKSRSWSSLLA